MPAADKHELSALCGPLKVERQNLKSLLEQVLTRSAPDDDGINSALQLPPRWLEASIWMLGWSVVFDYSSQGQPFYEPSPGAAWVIVPPVLASLDAANALAERLLGPSYKRESNRVLSRSGEAIFRVRFHDGLDPHGGFEAHHTHEIMAVVAAVLGTLLIYRS